MTDVQTIQGYRDLARHLQRQIGTGEYTEGSRLPTEMQMSNCYGLNRHTIRAALQELENDGFIYRVRGKGTYVARQRIPYAITPATSFTAAIEKLGLEGRAELVRGGTRRAGGEIARLLQIHDQDEVVMLEIRRFIDEAPGCVTTSFLPHQRFPALAQAATGMDSLYRLLRERYHVSGIRRHWSEIEATIPETRERELLQMPLHMPLLLTRSLVLDGRGIPVEYCISRYRSDTYTLRVDLGGKDHPL